MILPLLKDLARPHVVEIIMLMKRGGGQSVNELSAALRMSYMGVKQHCTYLEKKGYVDTWLRPKSGGGRPEKMYRLTAKMDGLFPHAAGETALRLLAVAEQSFGANAVHQMLEQLYTEKTERYRKAMKGRSLLERAQCMARLRQAQGCLSICEFDAHEGLRIIEYHSPLGCMIDQHPFAAELEALMFGTVMKCEAERLDLSKGRITRIEFRLKAQAE
jgi:hypothetical protein